MERIPEPQLMDDPAQAQAYAYADFELPHEQFVDLFQETFSGDGFSGTLLDLGCGPGDITRRVARRFPQLQIDAVDGADAMLDLGRSMTQQAGLEQRIHYMQSLLPDNELPRHHYDIVISNSLLHHLDEPTVLWRSIRQCAKPQAKVFVMDLMRPDNKQGAQALVQQYAEGEAEVLRQDFYNSLLAAYRVAEVRRQLLACGLTQLQVSVVSDRHFTVSGYL